MFQRILRPKCLFSFKEDIIFVVRIYLNTTLMTVIILIRFSVTSSCQKDEKSAFTVSYNMTTEGKARSKPSKRPSLSEAVHEYESKGSSANDHKQSPQKCYRDGRNKPWNQIIISFLASSKPSDMTIKEIGADVVTEDTIFINK